jgi:hypothetical protein
MSSKKVSQQAFAAGKTSALRSRLLGGTALTLSLAAVAAPANAQNVLTYNGAPVPSTILFGGLGYTPIGGTTVANVNTSSINAGVLGNGVWIAQFGAAGTQNITVGSGLSVTGDTGVLSTAYNDTVNVVNNGAIVGTVLDGVYAWNTNGLLGTPGSISVSGPGTINGNRNGVWLTDVLGAVNVGAAGAPVGAVTGGTNGIVITGGTGANNINASSVTGTTGYGIWTANTTGNQAISTTGAITGLSSGEYLNSVTGNIVANGNGTSTATGTGAVSTGITAGTSGTMTVQNYAGITGNTTGAWLVGSTGAANVTNNGPITGTTSNGTLIATTTGAINVNANGPITGGIYGVQSASVTGDISTSNNGAILGGTSGVYLATAGAGTLTTNNNASITGTSVYGVYGTAAGAISTNNNGAITGGNTGVSVASITGPVTVTGNGPVTGTAGYGVYGLSTSGSITVDSNGPVAGAVTGVQLATTGAISVSSNTSVRGANGIITVGGDTVVNNNGPITGTGGVGVYTTTTVGTQSINGNGAITGSSLQGIAATSTTGAIGVGNTAFNGVVTGATNGIQALSSTGNVAVSTNSNVTGTGNIGIYTSTAGNTVNNITAGNVTGGIWGMDTLAQGTGNITNNIAAGSIVQGGVTGLVEGTISGTSTTNNLGIIRSTTDTGAANTIGGSGIITVAGTNIINNPGQIVGRVDTAGLATTINNTGVWTPSANGNSFGSLNDTVNNAGLINVRAGSTTFAGLEALNNQTGGVINMAYSSAPTDNLTVLNLSPRAGSVFNFNFDATAANNAALGFDNTGNGKGTADTIFVAGTSAPTGVSVVNLTNVGTPASLTGSVALIYTGINLVAPAAGATIVSSTNYTFGTGDPSTGATKYYLVDDGKGGLYLQWAPNTNASTLGGFGGAIGAGGSKAPGGAGSSIASAIGGAASSSAGVGGVGLGGGPTGGGVAGRIGDIAAAGASSGGGTSVGPSGGSMKDGGGVADTTSYCRERRYAWGQVEADRTGYNGGGEGKSENIAAGGEADIGQSLGFSCNRLAIGMFGFGGNSRTTLTASSNKTESGGIGGYVRAGSGNGFYGSLMGAASWAEANLTNIALGSSASKDSKALTGAASLGYLMKLRPTTAVDVRGFASYNRDKSNGFTDTVGITVTDTRDSILTYGASIGLHQSFNPNLHGFVRGGVKWANLDSSITSFGNTFTGTVKGRSTALEAGLIGNLGRNVELGVSGFGTHSDGSHGFGGKAQIGVKF